jgi:hypothetical protein
VIFPLRDANLVHSQWQFGAGKRYMLLEALSHRIDDSSKHFKLWVFLISKNRLEMFGLITAQKRIDLSLCHHCIECLAATMSSLGRIHSRMVLGIWSYPVKEALVGVVLKYGIISTSMCNDVIRLVPESDCVPEQAAYSGTSHEFRDKSRILGQVTYSRTKRIPE